MMKEYRDREKDTQGYKKMVRYLEDLSRNTDFRYLITRLNNLSKSYRPTLSKAYAEMTEDEKFEHDRRNDEFGEIFDGYEQLRKRANKLLLDKPFKLKLEIAELYGLDLVLIDCAAALMRGDKDIVEKLSIMFGQPDLCRILPLWDDNLNPANPGEEIIHLSPHRKVLYTAYPVGIAIHPRASKRDVLDFIEKRWDSIKAAGLYVDVGPIRIKDRSYSPEIADFIWNKQSMPPKLLEKSLAEKFPDSNLVYYEINQILRKERERRFKEMHIV